MPQRIRALMLSVEIARRSNIANEAVYVRCERSKAMKATELSHSLTLHKDLEAACGDAIGSA